MKYLAAGLLITALVLTILLVMADRAVPGHYNGWGALDMTKVFLLVGWRWLVLTVAFGLLVGSGALNGWGRSTPLRMLLVLAGVFVLEVSGYSLHFHSVMDSIKPNYKTIFAVLAVLLPVCAIASGFFSMRWLFLLGVLGAMAAALWGESGEQTFMFLKRPFVGDFPLDKRVEYLLGMANPMYDSPQIEEVLTKIEQQPDWIEQVAQRLDGEYSYNALYLLCRKPDRLSPELQEQCWVHVGTAAAELEKKRPYLTTSEVLALEVAVEGLASQPGSLRDQHRAEFVAAVQIVRVARKESSIIPDLDKVDWVAGGK